MSWLRTHQPWSPLACLWRVLAVLCCVLLLLPAATPAVHAHLGARSLNIDSEGEERRPVEDDEDSQGGESSKPGGQEQEMRLLRHRRYDHTQAVRFSWQAHLTHHRGGTPGYSLPVCTPFEWGAHLPLRC